MSRKMRSRYSRAGLTAPSIRPVKNARIWLPGHNFQARPRGSRLDKTRSQLSIRYPLQRGEFALTEDVQAEWGPVERNRHARHNTPLIRRNLLYQARHGGSCNAVAAGQRRKPNDKRLQ